MTRGSSNDSQDRGLLSLSWEPKNIVFLVRKIESALVVLASYLV